MADIAISTQVLTKVNELQKLGELQLPKDYLPQNALKSAELMIQDIEGIGDCSGSSIYKSLMKMVTEGLNPMQHQCAFIKRGKTLTCQRQYQGSIALAKRKNPTMLQPKAHTVFEGDEFEYETEISTGRVQVTKHKSSLKNRDMKKIIGAFCIVPFADGSYDCCVMSMSEIKQSWLMGTARGNSPAHINFPDQQCEKTVFNRALKLYIDGNNDFEESEIIQQHQETIEIEHIDVDVEFEKTETVEASIIEKPTETEVKTTQTAKPNF